nr:Chain C, LEU-TYR-LEU-PRO-VAL-ARG-VAL-LEU-ILE [Homo sapiens]8SBL_C Chain C, LEU-TYR-LEU-PRO-VAL-ARG-VAL-LEU-ILE [Homo sapiens]8SBL_F Chain F, LEU-TYR-LEU-PRO-VAL-ARG-VAL-LEU-ILE [Homo sapiens]8SBL_I Chain I, LEU-TYR-LEU-PRO-VAL-ARG-VAL-LEU-ILE [Homo sapiens]8SBL_L Chain L, LEU-TYR-LEU-PRO-VAL-ARG-VAL-LEU-ILE [Homo sapiens]
LYLPVRVLI